MTLNKLTPIILEIIFGDTENIQLFYNCYNDKTIIKPMLLDLFEVNDITILESKVNSWQICCDETGRKKKIDFDTFREEQHYDTTVIDLREELMT